MSEKWIFIIWGGALLLVLIIGIIAAHIGCHGDSECFSRALQNLSNAIK